MSKFAPIDLEQIAKDTAAKMTAVAQQTYAVKPVRVLDCWMCWGFGYTDAGDRCFNCGGRGRVATEGGEP